MRQAHARLRGLFAGRRHRIPVWWHEAYQLPIAGLEARAGIDLRRADAAAWALRELGVLDDAHLRAPSRASLADLARVHTMDYAATLAADPAVRARLQAGIDDVNAALGRDEQIRRFAVLPGELTLEAGELTASLKVKRQVVAARHRAALDALYA